MTKTVLALFVALLAITKPALATTPGCACRPENETITKPVDLACLDFHLFWSCDRSLVKNTCAFPVDLLDWPIVMPGTIRWEVIPRTTLPAGAEIAFVASDAPETQLITREFKVSVGGNEQTVGIRFDRVCSKENGTTSADTGGGCALAGPPADTSSDDRGFAGFALLFAAVLGLRRRRRYQYGRAISMSAA